MEVGCGVSRVGAAKVPFYSYSWINYLPTEDRFVWLPQHLPRCYSDGKLDWLLNKAAADLAKGRIVGH